MTAGVAMTAAVLAVGAWTRQWPRWRGNLRARARLHPTGQPAPHWRGRWASAPGWFTRLVERVGPTDLVDVDRWWRRGAVGLGVGVVAATAVGGPPVGALVLGMVAVAPALAGPWVRDRYERRLEAQLPAFLDAIAAGLRSGSTLTTGVVEAAERVAPPLRRHLAPVVAGVRAGSPLPLELDAWADGHRSPTVRTVVAALVLGLGAGGPQADTIDAIGDTLRDRMAIAGETRALASQARASAVVIGAAPVVFAVVAALADPTVLHFLVGTPAGLACVAGGAVLDGAGAAWMRSITRDPP